MIAISIGAGVLGLLIGFYAGYRYTTYKIVSSVLGMFGGALDKPNDGR